MAGSDRAEGGERVRTVGRDLGGIFGGIFVSELPLGRLDDKQGTKSSEDLGAFLPMFEDVGQLVFVALADTVGLVLIWAAFEKARDRGATTEMLGELGLPANVRAPADTLAGRLHFCSGAWISVSGSRPFVQHRCTG